MTMDEFKVIAKEDVKILMQGDRYSNFIKGNVYRAINHNDCVIILDENRCGNSFEKDIFIKYFEEENDSGADMKIEPRESGG